MIISSVRPIQSTQLIPRSNRINLLKPKSYSQVSICRRAKHCPQVKSDKPLSGYIKFEEKGLFETSVPKREPKQKPLSNDLNRKPKGQQKWLGQEPSAHDNLKGSSP